MAKVEIVKWVDDLDGGEANQTIKFGFGDVLYEIDLSQANADKLREAFAPYVGNGRRVMALNGRPAKPGYTYQGGTRTVTPAKVDREQNAAMRAWWATNWKPAGLAAPGVGNAAGRGRIPNEVVEAFHKHGGRTLPPKLAAVPDPGDMATNTGAAVALAAKATRPRVVPAQFQPAKTPGKVAAKKAKKATARKAVGAAAEG